ncbi:ABC transporter ATP-binding protein [Pullulanibacillus sp. KACC 23026]|uniref:ABC transporter ATP-binding protein n=1 Tax=Pullulanibacillus sp. KACC 23026 TaxID=3028315 RepID=UPI0023B170D3|nr:ABC transporter ATP-binding protein [Pullulanibacillus sp. KACC 23026]WEG13345.1 ABC transporter ATP-binding protein [Pullulanibacillus sp. KACC 23026]
MVLIAQTINKVYKSGKTEFQALTNVNLAIKKGEIVVILGPSGSGKSTLLNAIGGIDRIDHGEIWVEDQLLTKMNSKQLVAYRRNVVGFVFQMYNLIPNLTVYENIELAAKISETPLSIKDMIKAVGLEGMDNRFPRELSGGQQQRVSIARAIVKNPRLLLCDEPTGALDSMTSKDILSLIKKINEIYNTTILIITHNQAISQMADRVITLKDGRVETDHVNKEKLDPERIEW